jgi:ABC-type arginine/histidine transport system permease subunit
MNFCSLTKSLFKLAFVRLFDLVGAGREIIGLTYDVLPVWLVIGAIYLAWITGFAKLMDFIYEKKKIPGVELLIQ